MQLNNDELLLKSKEEIIEIVFDQYGEQIKRLIFTYVKNHAQTDDVFQDFLISVYQNLHQFNGRSAFSTWLFRIAINKCKDFLKSPLNRLLLFNEHVKTNKVDKSPEQLTLQEGGTKSNR